jgi:hypothetical protein
MAAETDAQVESPLLLDLLQVMSPLDAVTVHTPHTTVTASIPFLEARAQPPPSQKV